MAGSGGGARGCGSSGGSVLGQICTWAWGNLGKACSEIITHEVEKFSHLAQGWGFGTSSISCRCGLGRFLLHHSLQGCAPRSGQSSDLLGAVCPSLPCAGCIVGRVYTSVPRAGVHCRACVPLRPLCWGAS